MERKLLTKRGRALYKKRGVLVDPPIHVFGQVKEGQGFRRFMRRGSWALHLLQWSPKDAAHNSSSRLWRSVQAPWDWAKAHTWN